MPRTVLVVDDERDTNDILASLVERVASSRSRYSRATRPSHLIAKQAPDLILLDVMLPDMDGFELCDRLKRTRETNLIPIVMVTALQDERHRAAGVRVGANGYLDQAVHAAAALRDDRLSPGLARGA